VAHDYKSDYLRELNAHKATKARLDEAFKSNAARDAELADLRRQRDAGKFATDAGEILNRAVETLQGKLKKTADDFNALRESALDGLAAATTAEVAALRRKVTELDTALRETVEAGIAKDEAISKSQDEMEPLKTRVNLLEKQKSDTFQRFAKRLPKGWAGRSARDLIQSGFNQAVHAFLVETLTWMNEEVIKQKPANPDVDSALNPTPEIPDVSAPMSETRMGGTLR